MQNIVKKSDPSALPPCTIPTAQRDFYYKVPDISGVDGAKKFEEVSKQYLQSRLENAVAALVDRVKVTTAKHLSDRRDGVLKNIEECRVKIAAIFDSIPGDTVVDKAQLDEICGRVKKAVNEFKSDRERNVDVSQKVSQIIYRIEQDLMNSLFDLPKKTVPQDIRVETLIKPDHLGVIIVQSNSIIELTTQLESLLILIKNKCTEFTKNSSILFNKYFEISKLIETFPDMESLNEIPEDVKDAILDNLKKYKLALAESAPFVVAYSTMDSTLINKDDLQRLISACDFYDGLMSYVSAPELKNQYKKLKDLKPKLIEALSIYTEAQNKISEFAVKVNAVRFSEEIRRLAASIIGFIPNGSEASIRAMFADIKGDQDEINESDDVEPRHIVQTGEVKEQPAEEESITRWPSFYWKKVAVFEANDEARRRLFSSYPLITYLLSNNKLEDLKFFVARLNNSDLNKSGLSSSCVGHVDSFCPSKEDLFDAILPELKEVIPFVVKGEVQEGRFRWKKQGRTIEEVQAEALRRLCQWPLLNELYLAQKWPELRQLLDKAQFVDLQACSINSSTVGPDAPFYKTTEEMFEDLFPEAYKKKLKN